MSEPVKITIDDRAAQRVRRGYPWIFRSEILGKPSESVGTAATFSDRKGGFVAQGYYSAVPQLAGRILTLDAAAKLDASFFESVLKRALEYRTTLYAGQNFYRWVHAESDGLPGLIIDRFGDVIVMQVNTAGMAHFYPQIESAILRLCNPRAILLRNDSPYRTQEGLAEETVLAYGALDKDIVEIVENGVKFQVDVRNGQKTGWFFDQRDNRAHVAALCRGKTMIDIFSHTGGFGIPAAVAGASAVTFVDSSTRALEGAIQNAALNGVAKKCSATEGKAFDVMEKLAQEKKVFDVVCVDPPAFIKSRKDMGSGLKGYEKLAKLAAPLVAQNGFLFFASCSHHASLEDLGAAVTLGINKSGRSFQLVRTGFAGMDHPVHPQLPESGYLKALTFRFLD